MSLLEGVGTALRHNTRKIALCACASLVFVAASTKMRLDHGQTERAERRGEGVPLAGFDHRAAADATGEAAKAFSDGAEILRDPNAKPREVRRG